MSDEIDEIIKSRTLTGELRSPAGERWLYTEDDLRAVAKAAYEKGGCDALDIVARGTPPVAQAARRALAKELLEKHRLDVAHAGFDVGKMLPDAQRIADSLLVDDLREIAGEA